MNATLRFWVLQTVAMMLTALLIPGLRIRSIIGAIAMVVALTVVNGTLWDAALFFRIPDSLTVQTLVLLVANGAIFWGLAKLLPGIEVRGILPALVAPLVFTVVGMLVARLAVDVDLGAIGREVLDAVRSLREWLTSGERQSSIPPV